MYILTVHAHVHAQSILLYALNGFIPTTETAN